MPWFKVDDKLHSHKKALKAGEALSLWVVAGSWCMDHLTDGFIPDYVALRMVPNAEKHASGLVSCGLWHPDEHEGESGWRFHDWDEYQPTKEDVDAKRESDRDRKRRQRRNERGQYEESQRSHAVTPRGVIPSRPDPTRPDPSRPKNNPARSARSTAEGGPTFDDFWNIYPKKVGKGQAEKAWRAATKKAAPEQIITGLREQLPSLAMQRKSDGDYRPHASTWLNGQRWADEVQSVEDDIDPLWRGAM